ncbi:hypothetical protein DPEC_G00308380 [Dallia pectoralis]|uniref:Uncharacterized protein n=1 Tax=Dallia pectoralis TaxID=75939 RepID=A0ACC2FEQ5_DALPE|nr:hypothetical protein DPEC_G00308380 [Dallia pectoralis]
MFLLGGGLMGNSSASFMGTFLASSLGSPSSHPSHTSRTPSSPSSPGSFRGGPHSSASQIWFPHSHEVVFRQNHDPAELELRAAPGYPRFSGSLAHTFLPMSHLDHHANGGVLYGQHRFYDTQKENFYLRSLPSQPPLISTNHSLPPISRAGPGHPQGSCSRDRDPGGGVSLHKGLKEGSADRGVVSGAKDKERPAGKQEAKERQQHHGHQPQPLNPHHHPHPGQLHPQQQYPQHSVSLEVNSRALERHKAALAMEYKEHHQAMGMAKPLSACLLNGKMQNGGDPGTGGTKASMTGYGGEVAGGRANQAGHRHIGGGASGRCTKEGVSGEMRISEQPSDCLEGRGQTLHHALPYSVAPPLHMGSTAGGGQPHAHPHPGGFHCLQLHPSHPHHPHHAHHHPDFFCPLPPAPLSNPSPHERVGQAGGGGGGGRETKVAGATFVPSVGEGHMGDKSGGQPFQNLTDCHGVVGSGGAKDKSMEKGGDVGHPGNWHRKQHQHSYRKAEKAPDWMQQQSVHHHLQPPQAQQSQPQQLHPQQVQSQSHAQQSQPQSHAQQSQPQSHAQQSQPQQQHQAARSRSVECINSVGVDAASVFLPQGAKTSHSLSHPVNTSPYRDCSHPGPTPNASPLGGRGGAGGGVGAGGANCSMQRDGQKVARIRHQQHGRPGPDAQLSAELNQSNGQNQDLKRKLEMSPYGYGNSGQQQQQQLHPQQPSAPPWPMRPPTLHVHPAEEEQLQHKSYLESLGGVGGRQHPQPGQSMGLPPHTSPQPPPHPAAAQQQDPQVASQAQGEISAMKSLLKYSNQQQPLLLSQKSPFGGLGSLKSSGAGGGNPGGSCTMQGSKQQQALPVRKGPASDGERADCGGRSREIGEALGHGEGEVRQPPVGIAVAVARQREPPCRPGDAHPTSRQGRVHPSMKGPPRSLYPSDPAGDEERKRMTAEQMGLTCLDRDRETYIRENKDRVEFARIHPSNSCHGDITSHLMVQGGTTLQSGQLGDPSAHGHTHSAHHHWMPRTGSPSLWMTSHSYGIGHSALHQNLPPGFSTAMPGSLQPVLPLPQDPSAQLVVLPTEPAAHPAAHHLGERL